MARNRLIFAAAAALAVSCHGGALASPWNKPDGKLFLSSKVDFYRSTTAISRYSRIDSDTYAEYGLTPKMMAGGKIVYSNTFIESAAGTDYRNGVSEGLLYLQRQLFLREHSALAIQLSGAWTGEVAVGSLAEIDPSGFDTEVRVLYGRDLLLSPVKIFGTAEAAFRKNLSGNADDARFDVLIGAEPSAKFLALLEAQSIISLRNESPGKEDFDLIKGQASLVWRPKTRWALQLGARRDFWSRAIPRGTSIFLGLWSEF